MHLLFNASYRKSIEFILSKTNHTIIILSAFLKTEPLKWLNNLILEKNINVSIVTRFLAADILSGASDLDAYKFANAHGWEFRLDPSLHSKVYLFDDETLFLGSANFTNRGLHLYQHGNFETGIKIVPSPDDIELLKEYVQSCTLLNEDTYFMLEEFIVKQPKPDTKNKIRWPQYIIQDLVKVERIWVKELLFSRPGNLLNDNLSNEDIKHDIGLLFLALPTNKGDILSAFYQSKVWYWLLNLLKKQDTDCTLFGKVTEELHKALLDDPKPYRKDAKVLVANLFEWIRWAKPPEVSIRKFNHTEGLFLTDKSL